MIETEFDLISALEDISLLEEGGGFGQRLRNIGDQLVRKSGVQP